MNAHTLWLASCLILLAGCASAPGRQSPAPVQEAGGWMQPEDRPLPAQSGRAAPATTITAAELLAYARRHEALSAEARRKEHGEVMQALSSNRKDTATRFRAALLFGTPGNPRRDPVRALALLTELQKDMSLDDDARMLASLLKNHLEERQKLDDQANTLALRLKEEQQKAETLQQKLDGLTRIEKSMMERSRGTAP